MAAACWAGGGGDATSGGGAAAAHRPMWFAQVPRPLMPTSCNAPVFTPGLPMPTPTQQPPRPSTPRGHHMQGESKACHQDSAPSTPMKQVVPSLTSPARQPSSWQMLRTPSPDAAHWNMHLKAEASASSEGISNDPEAWASAPVVVAIQSY